MIPSLLSTLSAFVLINILTLLQPVSSLTFETRQYSVNFDELAYDVSRDNPIGIYDGLHWKDFGVFQGSNTSKIGHSVIPASKPAYAVGRYSYLGDNPDVRSPPAMSTYFPGSQSVFFDLHWFNWACLMSGPSHPGLQPETATDCYLQLRGWEPNQGSLILRHESTHYFVMNEVMKIWGIIMSSVNLSGYYNACQYIEFEVKSFSGREVVLLLDNVFYRTYNVTDFARPSPGIKSLRHDGIWGTEQALLKR